MISPFPPVSTPLLHACGVDDDAGPKGVLNPVPGAGHFNRTLLGQFWRAAKGMRPKEAQRTTELLRSLQLLPITFTVAALAGSLKYDYAKKGITLSLTDAIIAAVAIHNQLTLITEIIKHFP
jgi:hypothetical protein